MTEESSMDNASRNDSRSENKGSEPENNLPLEPLATSRQGKAETVVKAKASALTSLFIALSLFVAIFALAGSAYLWQELQLLSKNSVAASDYRLDILKSGQNSSEQTKLLTKLEASVTATVDKQALVSEDVNLLKSKIANISGINRIDWLSDELQHLTRLAHQRLVLSHDPTGAIVLLEAADKVVIEMRLTSTLPIRQALAKDITNLRIASDVDLEGAYIRLNSMQEKIKELAMARPNYAQDLKKEQKKELAYQSPQGDVEDRVSSALTYIGEKLQPYLFRAYRIDEDITPVLNSDERRYLLRNIELAISQAQLALLRREAESYRLSLLQSEKWVARYFDEADTQTQTVLKLINELKAYQLNPELPKIDASLDAVNEFADTWQQEKTQQPTILRNLNN